MRAWVKVIGREPFFQFLALGLLMWGGVEYLNAHNNHYTIDIGPAERERIATSYLQQYGQLPTRSQLHALIDRHIRDEIFLREGLALHLDKDDEVVRRRIVQKYEFLETDLAVPEPPSPLMLVRWFEENKSRYLIPEHVAFSQVYFTVNHQGEEAAKSRAAQTLEELRRMRVSRAPERGDVFPGPADVAALSPEEARRLFGASELSKALFKLPIGQWVGPYRSGYGWHLIYVIELTPPVLPTLSDVHARVLADYLDEQRRVLNERAFEKLRAQYRIRSAGAGPQGIYAKSNVIPEPAGGE